MKVLFRLLGILVLVLAVRSFIMVFGSHGSTDMTVRILEIIIVIVELCVAKILFQAYGGGNNVQLSATKNWVKLLAGSGLVLFGLFIPVAMMVIGGGLTKPIDYPGLILNTFILMLFFSPFTIAGLIVLKK